VMTLTIVSWMSYPCHLSVTAPEYLSTAAHAKAGASLSVTRESHVWGPLQYRRYLKVAAGMAVR
jgi:hypothetical protein